MATAAAASSTLHQQENVEPRTSPVSSSPQSGASSLFWNDVKREPTDPDISYRNPNVSGQYQTGISQQNEENFPEKSNPHHASNSLPYEPITGFQNSNPLSFQNYPKRQEAYDSSQSPSSGVGHHTVQHTSSVPDYCDSTPGRSTLPRYSFEAQSFPFQPPVDSMGNFQNRYGFYPGKEKQEKYQLITTIIK